MDQELQAKILEILENQNDLTVATVRSDGYPQATTVGYANDGLTIYFACAGNSQKARNIANNNKVSLTVNVPYTSWDDIQGLSIGGIAERVSKPGDLQHVRKLMVAKFPQIAEFEVETMTDVVVFRITPQVISVLDYTKGFGHTDLVELTP